MTRSLLLLGLAALASGCMPVKCMPVTCPACPGPIRDGAHVLRAGRSGLINPILDVEPNFEFQELRPFAHKIKSLIDAKVTKGEAQNVSVYFRDLNNGPFIGIEEKAKFAPASLLKVPLMMAVLKAAQKDPQLLQRRQRYLTQTVASPRVSTTTLVEGQEYTVDELLRAMIANSDNNAAFILVATMEPSALEQVYQDLGLSIPNLRTASDAINVREYASFFRILYNAAYLNREMSEKALEYLTTSNFNEGLIAGLPAGITVAHKFGERVLEDKMQLHDCGIVYGPDLPYLLCVMTRGRDVKKLEGVIAEVSRLVYTEVDSQIQR